MAATSSVLVEDREHVLVITLNRPEVRNAINLEMSLAIGEAMDRLDSDDTLRAAVITGAGGTFCAGMDLKAFAAGERPLHPVRGFAGLVARPPRKPLIAAVEGYALAGGCEIALACDLIVSADDATFGLPEVRRGLVAAAGGLVRLPRKVGPAIATQLALTGENFGGRDAAAFGLVNRLTAPGEALEVAVRLAEQIAKNAPLAVAATKQILAESWTWPADEAFGRQEPVVAPVRASDDALEGARAFKEKREPVWQGR